MCNGYGVVKPALAVEYGLLDLNKRWRFAYSIDVQYGPPFETSRDSQAQEGSWHARNAWLTDVRELKARHA